MQICRTRIQDYALGDQARFTKTSRKPTRRSSVPSPAISTPSTSTRSWHGDPLRGRIAHGAIAVGLIATVLGVPLQDRAYAPRSSGAAFRLHGTGALRRHPDSRGDGPGGHPRAPPGSPGGGLPEPARRGSAPGRAVLKILKEVVTNSLSRDSRYRAPTEPSFACGAGGEEQDELDRRTGTQDPRSGGNGRPRLRRGFAGWPPRVRGRNGARVLMLERYGFSEDWSRGARHHDTAPRQRHQPRNRRAAAATAVYAPLQKPGAEMIALRCMPSIRRW